MPRLGDYESCRRIYIVCRDDSIDIPYGAIVTRGFSKRNCRVVFSFPDRCVVTPSTRIVFTDDVKVFVNDSLLKNNIVIFEEIGGKKYAYVYPREVYNKIMNDYIEPMLNGKPPITSGILLAGAPGTGKTTLAELIAKWLGIATYYIEPDIKSKFVGETERNLKKIIIEAMNSEPSIIIIDDCDWLLSGRKLSQTDEDNIKNTTRRLMLKYMQEITNKKKRVLFIATTNKKVDVIDIAFRRPGRFGDPIIVPLPDLEAIKFLLRYYGVEKDIDRLAIKLLNAGASASHVVNIAKKVASGEKPVIKPQAFRGYKRFFVEPIQDFDKIFNYIPRDVFGGRSRIYFRADIDVGISIALQVVSLAGKSAIVINDPQYIDEAVHTANMYGSVIILPTIFPDMVQYYVHTDADYGVIYVGLKPPSVPHASLFSVDVIRRIIGVEALVRAVASYRDIDMDDDMFRKTVKALRNVNDIERALSLFASLGAISDTILDIL